MLNVVELRIDIIALETLPSALLFHRQQQAKSSNSDDVLFEEEVELPEHIHLRLEPIIEYLVAARQDLEAEEAIMLWRLFNLQQAEEVQTDSREECPPNEVEDQLPQAVNPEAELERIIELLIHARKNLQAEEATLLEELSSRQPVEEEGQTNAKKRCNNPLAVPDDEQVQDV